MRRRELAKPFRWAPVDWSRDTVAPQPGTFRRLFMATCLFLLASHPAAALDQVSMQLKWKHQFQFAGYYAALERFPPDVTRFVAKGIP
jgi:hypothetical protein